MGPCRGTFTRNYFGQRAVMVVAYYSRLETFMGFLIASTSHEFCDYPTPAIQLPISLNGLRLLKRELCRHLPSGMLEVSNKGRHTCREVFRPAPD